MLTSEQRTQFFADMQSATPDQFATALGGSPTAGTTGGTYPIPEKGFPPHPSISPTTPATPMVPPNFPMTGESTDPAAPAHTGYAPPSFGAYGPGK